MPPIKTPGLVMQHTNIGEYDRMLCVLSPKLGIIQVSAKGARSMKAGLHNATRSFCYAEFVLYPAKKEIYTLKSASPLEVFFALAEDLDRLEAATMIAKFTRYLCLSADYASDMLRLVLDSYYALCHGGIVQKVETTFLLKAAQISGFSPDVAACARCGGVGELIWFDCTDGTCLCSGCSSQRNLTPALLAMFRYILSSSIERCFNYRAQEELIAAANKLLVDFVQQHIGYWGAKRKPIK